MEFWYIKHEYEKYIPYKIQTSLDTQRTERMCRNVNLLILCNNFPRPIRPNITTNTSSNLFNGKHGVLTWQRNQSRIFLLQNRIYIYTVPFLNNLCRRQPSPAFYGSCCIAPLAESLQSPGETHTPISKISSD